MGVKFVCTVYSASGPMVSVVGDDGSGDPLHERCDESDVYEGEVAQVDVVPELVGWFDGIHSFIRVIYIYKVRNTIYNNHNIISYILLIEYFNTHDQHLRVVFVP